MAQTSAEKVHSTYYQGPTVFRDQFPLRIAEIIHIILNNLDEDTLRRVRFTCRLWNSVASKLLKTFPVINNQSVQSILHVYGHGLVNTNTEFINFRKYVDLLSDEEFFQTKFGLIQFNEYCFDKLRMRAVPAEVSCKLFSLKYGESVKDSFSTLVDPGRESVFSWIDAKENMRKYGLPMPSYNSTPGLSYGTGEEDFKKILKSVFFNSFCLRDAEQNVKFILFTTEASKAVTISCLSWLLLKCGKNLKIRILSAERLIGELARSTYMRSNPTQLVDISNALGSYEFGRRILQPPGLLIARKELACKWHRKFFTPTESEFNTNPWPEGPYNNLQECAETKLTLIIHEALRCTKMYFPDRVHVPILKKDELNEWNSKKSVYMEYIQRVGSHENLTENNKQLLRKSFIHDKLIESMKKGKLAYPSTMIWPDGRNPQNDLGYGATDCVVVYDIENFGGCPKPIKVESFQEEEPNIITSPFDVVIGTSHLNCLPTLNSSSLEDKLANSTREPPFMSGSLTDDEKQFLSEKTESFNLEKKQNGSFALDSTSDNMTCKNPMTPSSNKVEVLQPASLQQIDNDSTNDPAPAYVHKSSRELTKSDTVRNEIRDDDDYDENPTIMQSGRQPNTGHNVSPLDKLDASIMSGDPQITPAIYNHKRNKVKRSRRIGRKPLDNVVVPSSPDLFRALLGKQIKRPQTSSPNNEPLEQQQSLTNAAIHDFQTYKAFPALSSSGVRPSLIVCKGQDYHQPNLSETIGDYCMVQEEVEVDPAAEELNCIPKNEEVLTNQQIIDRRKHALLIGESIKSTFEEVVDGVTREIISNEDGNPILPSALDMFTRVMDQLKKYQNNVASLQTEFCRQNNYRSLQKALWQVDTRPVEATEDDDVSKGQFCLNNCYYPYCLDLYGHQKRGKNFCRDHQLQKHSKLTYRCQFENCGRTFRSHFDGLKHAKTFHNAKAGDPIVKTFESESSKVELNPILGKLFGEQIKMNGIKRRATPKKSIKSKKTKLNTVQSTEPCNEDSKYL